MLDRYGNVIRTDGDQDQQQADWERAADMPQKGKNYMKPGWTVNDVEYPEYPTSRGHRYEAGGPSPANDVVTRDAGYTPYQSLFPHEPTGYDPTGRQYPQSRQDELALGRHQRHVRPFSALCCLRQVQDPERIQVQGPEGIQVNQAMVRSATRSWKRACRRQMWRLRTGRWLLKRQREFQRSSSWQPWPRRRTKVIGALMWSRCDWYD
jgi:hypothetical protein